MFIKFTVLNYVSLLPLLQAIVTGIPLAPSITNFCFDQKRRLAIPQLFYVIN
jgi:hypothetical protein